MALEHQLQVGDCIYGFQFPTGKSGGSPGFTSDGVVDATMKVRRVNQVIKKRVFKKDKVINTVEHRDVAFRWLPWVSGKINYGDLEGKDMLSGMFTGCWMVVYKEGNYRVGHVATQSDAGDCKATWRAHKALTTVSDVKEFRPDIGLPGAMNLGLVTSTRELYKIQLATEKNVLMPNPWRSVAEWTDPAKGKQAPEFARFLAEEPDVDVTQVYPGASYRILKISGPLAAEAFPAA